MFWDKSSRAEKAVVIWALVLVTAALLVVLVALGSVVSDNSSNVASWVQAVGSIAAIRMGVWGVQHQLEEQRRERSKELAEAARTEKVGQYEVLRARLLEARAVIVATSSIFGDGEQAPHPNKISAHARKMQWLAAVFKNIEPKELPHPAAVFLRQSLVAMLEDTERNLDLFAEESASGAIRKAGLTSIGDTAFLAKEVANAGVGWCNDQLNLISNSAEQGRIEETFEDLRQRLIKVTEHFSPSDSDPSQSQQPPAASLQPKAG